MAFYCCGFLVYEKFQFSFGRFIHKSPRGVLSPLEYLLKQFKVSNNHKPIQRSANLTIKRRRKWERNNTGTMKRWGEQNRNAQLASWNATRSKSTWYDSRGNAPITRQTVRLIKKQDPALRCLFLKALESKDADWQAWRGQHVRTNMAYGGGSSHRWHRGFTTRTIIRVEDHSYQGERGGEGDPQGTVIILYAYVEDRLVVAVGKGEGVGWMGSLGLEDAKDDTENG